jgi:DNA-directed RNA polymerase specialized sigma24 family protein
MANTETLALLKEALEFFNDRPNFGLRRRPRQTSYDLAARIDRRLGVLDAAQTNRAAVEIAHSRWATTALVRVEPDETETTVGDDGIWVRAWVLVPPTWLPPEQDAPITVDPEHYRAAVMALPPITRTVFLLHRVDGLDYGAIAQRTSLSLADVEQQIAEAIVGIDRALRRDREG